MCSSTYMAFSQNTSHPMGRSPLWLFARTFLNFCHFEGVRMALGQTWFAHMQEPFTRIPNLVLTQKSHLAPTSQFPRTRQKCEVSNFIKKNKSWSVARWFKRKPSTRRDIIQKSDITKLCAFTYYPMVFVKYTFLCNDSWPHTPRISSAVRAGVNAWQHLRGMKFLSQTSLFLLNPLVYDCCADSQ